MGKIQDQVNRVLDQEVDRKQFLQLCLTIFFAAFGISGMISAVLSSDHGSKKSNKPKVGYGSSRFND